jgi:hypothetical protein
MERLMIRVGRPSIEPHAAATAQWLVAPDDPTTVRPTVSKSRPISCPWRTMEKKMLDERPAIGRIGYRRHPSATPCDHRHLDNRVAGRATVRRIVMATVLAPSLSGFS